MASPSLAARLARFGLVGGIGFVIDIGILGLLTAVLSVDPFTSRVASISAASLATWRLNRLITFGPSQSGQAAEAARYGGVVLLTQGANYAIYAALLMFVAGLPPVLAATAASIAAMFVSYLGYARFAFRIHRRGEGLVAPRRHSSFP